MYTGQAQHRMQSPPVQSNTTPSLTSLQGHYETGSWSCFSSPCQPTSFVWVEQHLVRPLKARSAAGSTSTTICRLQSQAAGRRGLLMPTQEDMGSVRSCPALPCL